MDGHLPERFSLVEFAPPPPPEVRRTPRPGRGLLAVRVLRPPVPLEVLTEQLPPAVPADEALPVEVRPVAGEETEKRPKIEGAVKVASGPWGLEDGWWSDAPGERSDREYWDVELAAGGLYRLYRDRATGEWFADGIYD